MNLPYLVANTYGFNLIKTGGIRISHGGQKLPVRGVTCDLWCPFSNLAVLFQWKVACENLFRIGWAFQELSCPQTFFRGVEIPIRGVTFDLWCPFSNSDVLFQSKVMCWNLVWIGWNQRYVKFEEGGRPLLRGGLHVTCYAHFRTWLSYSSQMSCVKIWFGLVEIGGANFQGCYMWPAMPSFELGRAIPVKSHVWKFVLDWVSLSRVIVSTNIFPRGRNLH